MEYKWIAKDVKIKYNKNDDIITKLAKIRGIYDINEWIRPTSKSLCNSYLLKNINEAVDRIIKAVHRDEKILIVGDQDGDGVFSTALMYRYLSNLTNNVDYTCTTRSMGHDISRIKNQFTDDIDLLIVLDSSTNAVELCKEIAESGIDIVIIDHHPITKENPYAIIVNCQDGQYPNPHLSGSAMTYKVCQVIDERISESLANEYIDLCAFGLITDMMDMRSFENRYLVYQGLHNIRNTGLKLILHNTDANMAHISTSTVAFKISPVLNAATRFEQTKKAIDALVTDDISLASELVKELIQINEIRKRKENELIEQCLPKFYNSHKVGVLIDDGLDSGFRGLIANHLAKRFQKPVLVLTPDKNNKYLNGSARTYGDIPFKQLCLQTQLFSFAEGHDGAFGVSLPRYNLEEALEALDVWIDKLDEPVLEYDLELKIEDLDDNLFKQVEEFNMITGVGVPEAKFLIKGLMVDDVSVLGSGNTLKIKCGDIDLIKFRASEEEIKKVDVFDEIDVIGGLNVNRWYHPKYRQVIETNQVFIDDFKVV